MTKTIYSIALLLSTQLAYAAIVADGPWTGADWYNQSEKMGVKNGIPYSDDANRQRELRSPLSIDGDVEDYLNMSNV